VSDKERLRNVDDLVKPEGGVGAGMIIAGIAMALFLIFVLQNLESGTVEFLWMELEMPKWIFLLVVFALGVIVGYYSKVRRIKRKAKKK
jgi:uncharacterized integral membrane protein